jgi:GT2 family glycosyltransferase
VKINVFIPHEPGKKLGEAYNRLMDESSTEWNLFIDRDILILNKHWYDMCVRAIEQSENAGWISCVTNRLGCHWQRANNYKSDDDYGTHDIKKHLEITSRLYAHFKDTLYYPDDYGPFSGHFILTNKTAWKAAGGFEPGWGCDNAYCEAIRKAGFTRSVMLGLYVYHIYDLKGAFNDI